MDTASLRMMGAQLMDAVLAGSVQGIVRLYALDRPMFVDIRDHEGNNILHIACKKGNLVVTRAILLLFENRYELRTKKNKNGKLPIETCATPECRKSLEIWDRGTALTTDKNLTFKQEMEKAINAQLIKDVLQSSQDKVTVMLSMDGGGIRGIVLLQILMALEKRLGDSVYKHFDWIAGTSTGAILSASLALNKTMEECLKIYLRLKNEVFSGSRPYNCTRYENYLKLTWGARAKMSDMKDHKVIITSCQSNLAPPKLKLYRSYQPMLESKDLREYEYEDPESVYVWKAARASSAAPTYFLPFEGIYSDGGLMANNPTEVMITEFFRYKQIQEYVGEVPPAPLACIVSLGTGMMAPVTISSKGRANDLLKLISRTTEQIKNLAKVLIKQITASDGLPVEKARTWSHSLGVPYFRFSPPLSQKIDLDENRDTFIIQMMWDCEMYILDCQEELDDLAKYLLCLHATDRITSSDRISS